MVILKSAYKFRAYPSKDQKEILNRQMYLSKEIYNLLLNYSKSYYKETKKTLTEYRMNVWLTKLKKKRSEFNELHFQVLQNVSKRISDAYKSFFRRYKEKKQGKKQGKKVKVGFPRYRTFVSSLTFPQSNGFKVERKRISLSKVGRINFVNHREIEGKTKTCTIKTTKSGEWYITLSVEKEDTIPFVNKGEQAGIDLGISNYRTLSDKLVLQNKHIPKKTRNKLRQLQKTISRRKKGSHKRKKAILNFARKYEHISRIKEDHLHRLSDNLVHSYSFIAYEELNIANMVKNHNLARSIGEESWGNLINYLQYKAESAGCAVVCVNPRNLTQECSDCGNIKKGEEALTLKNRTYHCFVCGLTMDRDLNASKVIKRRGLEKFNSWTSERSRILPSRKEGNSTTPGQGGSYASGDIVRPRLQEADVIERGTILGVSR